ncbi:HAD family phosphatase [Candidatus Woesearchaeota archaeon]|nr:HAD family phosphatase [Candidatus Woesearchaeota archaeon]
MKRKQFKAVIFDIDGLLLDSEILQYKAWVQNLKDQGVNPPEVEGRFTEQHYAAHYAGVSAETIAIPILCEFGLESIVAEMDFLRRRDEILDDLFRSEEINYMPGALEALEYFISIGAPVILATSGDGYETPLKLAGSPLGEYVKEKGLKVVVRKQGIKGKPEPDIFLATAKELGYAPGDCLVFEDSRSGYDAAVAAGMTCFAIATKWTAPNLPEDEIENRYESLADAIKDVKQNYGLVQPSSDNTS